MNIKRSNDGEHCGRIYSDKGGCPGLRLLPNGNNTYRPVCAIFRTQDNEPQELDFDGNLPIPCSDCQATIPCAVDRNGLRRNYRYVEEKP